MHASEIIVALRNIQHYFEKDECIEVYQREVQIFVKHRLLDFDM